MKSSKFYIKRLTWDNVEKQSRLRLRGRPLCSKLLLFAVSFLACRAVFGPFMTQLGLPQAWTRATLDSCDLDQCIAAPASTTLIYHDLFRTWMNEQLSPACREKCWIGNFGELCQDCSDLDARGNEEKQRQCRMYCAVHGSCPLFGPREKPHPVCAAYDASLRESRVALLRSLGATVQPGAHYGIEVHGINLRQPWVLAHAELLCAIQHLTQDYLFVNFKRQEGTDCEFDHAMCYALGKAHVPKTIPKSGARINTIANHPLVGIHYVPAEGWHIDGFAEACSHGIYDVVEVQPPHGATAFSVIRDVIHGLPKERLEYWRRVWWQSVTYTKYKNIFKLLKEHPITREVYIDLNNVARFGIDMDKPTGRMFDPEENQRFQDELDATLSAHSFNASWEKGDFAYADNLLLLHKTWPENANRPDKALRVLRKASCNCFPVHSLPPPALVGVS